MKILNAIRDLGLGIDNSRGQGYDGAGSLAGKKSEALSRILELNNKAVNVHCFNYRFNLAIAKSRNIQKLQNLMVIIKEIYFINLSPHKEQCLKDAKNYLM